MSFTKRASRICDFASMPVMFIWADIFFPAATEDICDRLSSGMACCSASPILRFGILEDLSDLLYRGRHDEDEEQCYAKL
jgi:hypothetical protein